jgi:hypothetical protein
MNGFEAGRWDIYSSNKSQATRKELKLVLLVPNSTFISFSIFLF